MEYKRQASARQERFARPAAQIFLECERLPRIPVATARFPPSQIEVCPVAKKTPLPRQAA